jgi:RHS repeat-associated protein
LKTIHHQQGANTVQKHDYTYDLAGNLVSWTRTPGAGSATAWALRHDPADQLSELEETLGGVSQKKESWHYDRAGNLASTVNTPAGQTGVLQMRTHTGRNQLTQLGGTGKTLVEGTTNEAATVKVNGQPAQVTKLGPSGPWRFQKEMDFPFGTTSITVEAKDGANNVRTNTYNVNVAASGAQTLEYDTNGNLLAVKDADNVVLRSFEWDASNRLLAIQIPGAVAAGTKRTEFVYDGAGRRVRQLDKEHNGTAWATQSHWYYLWDGLELAQKRDAASGNVLVNYFSNGEQQGANSLVYLSDHLGSPRSWYRVSDGAVGSADYSAYGVRTVTTTGPGVPERGYTGHLHHLASGLALAPYRAYDPALGRWISEDPIQERGGVNLYGYVHGSPVGHIDVLGLARYEYDGQGFHVHDGKLTYKINLSLAGIPKFSPKPGHEKEYNFAKAEKHFNDKLKCKDEFSKMQKSIADYWEGAADKEGVADQGRGLRRTRFLGKHLPIAMMMWSMFGLYTDADALVMDYVRAVEAGDDNRVEEVSREISEKLPDTGTMKQSELYMKLMDAANQCQGK